MVTTFEELCRELDIKSSSSNQDLEKLIHWCENTISTDIHFQGALQERLDFYKDLATDFLEYIKPNVLVDNLTAPVSLFEEKTSLQVIVDSGLNIYLKALNPSAMQVNSKVNGVTLLLLSAVRGHLHTTETLLSLGANPKEKNNKGAPILFVTLALPIDHDEQMKINKQSIYILLSPYFDNILNERNESGDTILHIMSLNGYDQLIDSLLSEEQTKELAFIANNSIHYPIHAAILNGQHHCVNSLIRVDGVEKLTDAKGRNALHYAALYSDREMVKSCLKFCSKDSFDIHHQNPLILASIANNADVVAELLNCGSEINATDDEHRSALHYAVALNKLSVVKQLLENPNINVNISDSYSQNPLDLVQQNTTEGAQINELLIAHRATHGQSLTNSMC
ncbi:MAG: ankyrin repeat domain-containing protein [Legionella sp.]|uniref:ankyrin repeat domain-containing protein n=1 Tax=Legionella sp. TaxID=459 RepID=UPI0039E2AF7E